MDEDKKVYDMSKDEQEHWEKEKEKHDEPFIRAGQAVEMALKQVIHALGVETEGKTDIQIQEGMMNEGIFIQSYDNLPDVAPQIQGLYIFQWRWPIDRPLQQKQDPVAIAFIGNPNVNSTGEIEVAIQWFDKQTMDIVKAGLVAKK